MRDQILTKIESMFMRYGIRSVTMDDIARELGISKKTLYKFVDNKEDLITMITTEHLRRERNIVDCIHIEAKDPIHEFINIVDHLIVQIQGMSQSTMYDLQKYYKENWNSFECFQREFVLNRVQENLKKGVEMGLYRSNINVDIIARFYISKPMTLLDEQLFPSKQFDKPTLLKNYLVYHIHGIATAKGLELFHEYLNEKTT
ncbi:MAG: TetR/AcrR family transcriptional regulator [Saprospiraceae bacterium]